MPVAKFNPTALTVVYAVGLHHYDVYGGATVHTVPGFDVALGTLVSVGVSYGDMELSFGGYMVNLSSTVPCVFTTGVVSPNVYSELVISTAAGTLDTLTQVFADQTSPTIPANGTWFLTTENHILTVGGATSTAAGQKTHFTSAGFVSFTVTTSLYSGAHQNPVGGGYTHNFEGTSKIGGGIIFITYTYTL